MARDVTPVSAYDDAHAYAVATLEAAAEDALAYLGVGWRSPQQRGAATKARAQALDEMVAVAASQSDEDKLAEQLALSVPFNEMAPDQWMALFTRVPRPIVEKALLLWTQAQVAPTGG